MRKLKNLNITEVSLVRRPANQRARVLFHKSRDRGHTMGTNTLADSLIAGFRKAVEAVEIDDPTLRKAAVEAGLQEAKLALEAAAPAPAKKGKTKKGAPKKDKNTGQFTSTTDSDDDEDDDEDDDSEDTEKAFSAIADTMLDLRQSADDASARVQKAEAAAAEAVKVADALRKERREEVLTKEAADLTSHMGGEIAPVVKTLLALDGNKESRDAYVASLKAANESSRKANLTTTNGFRTPQQMTGEQAIAAKADDLRTSRRFAPAAARARSRTEDLSHGDRRHAGHDSRPVRVHGHADHRAESVRQGQRGARGDAGRLRERDARGGLAGQSERGRTGDSRHARAGQAGGGWPDHRVRQTDQ